VLKAYDFSYTYQGKTLYYTYDKNNGVKVVALGDTNYVTGHVVIPSTVTFTYGETITAIVSAIGDNAFATCFGLTSIEIPNSVTEIGYDAFKGCTSLTSIEIPSSVTFIDNDAFYNCSSLDTITINSNYVCKNFWGDNATPTILKIDGEVTTIDSLAFESCTSLTTVEISAPITTISYGAFNACTSLTSINIPSSVTEIGGWAFNGCLSLQNINLPSSLTTLGVAAFQSCSSLANIDLPSSLTTISDWTFSSCYSLTNIEIPSSVNEIGNWVFSNCSSLTSITIPNSVTFIGNNAFFNCSSLDTITINSNYVCKNFWGDNATPTILKIGGEVTTIDSLAFVSCTSLTTVEISAPITTINYGAFYNCTSLADIDLPSSVTTIDDWAFAYCSSLTNIDLPSSLTTIGSFAFSNCTSLANIDLPSSLTTIIYAAFAYCSSLTNIDLPSSLTTIDSWAFGYCTSLTNIEIPASVSLIGSSAFSGCPNLTSIVVDSTNTVYDSRDNCNAIIESSTNKLIAGCNTTIIPTSVTSIGKLAFNESHIKKVEIPSSVTEIETKAFVDCTELDTIICKNPTPIAIDSTIFQNIPTDAVLLVPCGSADAYSSADIWSSFQNIVTYSSDQEINVTICANEIYDFNGQTLYQTGTYTDTINDSTCTIIITLNLTVLPDSATTTILDVEINDNEYYSFANKVVYMPGTYTDTLKTTKGCDSVIIVNLTVNYDTTIVIPDSTITIPDTSVVIGGNDTIIIIQYDTILVDNYIYDTLLVDNYIYDTVFLGSSDTIILYDTIIQTIYDTSLPCPKIYTYIYATIDSGGYYSDYGFNLLEPGTYIDTLLTEDGCDSIVTLYLISLVGIEDAEPSQIVMYPNPTEDKVYLSLSNIPNAEITIRDISGKVVKRHKVSPSQNEVVLNVEDLASGTYTIMINNNHTHLTKKLIKR
jgi:hypothetical protein